MMRIETKRTLGLYRNCATRHHLGEALTAEKKQIAKKSGNWIHFKNEMR